MPLTNQELLQKATFTTADLGLVGGAPLSVEQVSEFITLTSAGQTLLPEVRTVTSNASKWTESILDFGGRITKPGVEATRLLNADRVKPTTGAIDISTVLLRAEVPVSDEAMEDSPARQGFADSLEGLITDQFGFDVEELAVNGDTASGDPYLALLDGWLKQAQGSGGHVVDAAATADPNDWQAQFGRLLAQIPNRHKRNQADLRFYVPSVLEESYRAALANRGTNLGDLMLTGTNELRYQGILIKGTPSFPVTGGNSYILLTHRQNLIVGWRRAVTLETFRDPREGATSFIVTARVDAKIGIRDATAIAKNVPVS